MVHCNWNAKSLAVKKEGERESLIIYDGKLGRKGGREGVYVVSGAETQMLVSSVPYRKALKVTSEGRKEGKRMLWLCGWCT